MKNINKNIIKAISVLVFIFGISFLVSSIYGLYSLITMFSTFSASLPEAIMYLLWNTVAGVFFIYLSIGIWKKKNWARISVILLSAVNLFDGLSSMIISLIRNSSETWILWLNLVILIIELLIIYTLLLNKKIKKEFRAWHLKKNRN